MNRARIAALFGLLSFLFCAAAPGARAAGRVECRAIASKILAREVHYCVLLPASYDAQSARRFPILYYLHGLGFNEQALVTSGAWNLIEDLREQIHLGEFLFAAPDGGTSFFINSEDGRQRYEDFFLTEFLPQVENRYRVLPGRTNRGITGMSMGGYGALHIAFRHPDLFGAVSAHSAALIANLPTVSDAAGRPTASPPPFGRVFGSPFDRAFWERNDPLQIARTAPGLNRLKIYFDCGNDDDYGFEAGANKLDEILTSRGIAHEYHAYPGRHDWVYFAGHIQASLEFHSRAFGAAPTATK
jgi:S-formylglutathione hydrolase FrmB